MADGMRELRKVLATIPGCEVSPTVSRHGWLVYLNGRKVGMVARKESDPHSLRNAVQALRRNGVPIRLVGSRPVVEGPRREAH